MGSQLVYWQTLSLSPWWCWYQFLVFFSDLCDYIFHYRINSHLRGWGWCYRLLDCFSNLLVELPFNLNFSLKCFHGSTKITHRINLDISYWQLWEKGYWAISMLLVWTSVFVVFTEDCGWWEEKQEFGQRD